MIEAIEDHKGFPFGLGELEYLGCRLPDGVTVEAKRRADLPWLFIFEGRHPEHGLRYFRARRRGGAAGEVEVWDVTEAVVRCLARRLQRQRRKAAADRKALNKRLQGAKIAFKPGLPTPERRRRGPVKLVVAPKRESADDPAVVYYAPDNLARLHRNGTITDNMLDASARFHAHWIRAGLDGVRPANLIRVSGGIGGQADAVLDASDKVHRICDRLGGYGSPGFQALIHVVGEGMTVAAWTELERRGPWRLDPNKAKGIVICALGVLEGFYRPVRKSLESAG